MDYLTISINFARQIPMLNPTTGEIALFHALLDLKNIDMRFASRTGKKKTWADGFDPTSATLQLYSGLSASGITKARSRLKQLGLIDFKSRGRRKSTVYRLLNLSTDNSTVKSNDKSNDISTDNSSDNSTDNSSDNSSALIKHKHKQNKTIKPSCPGSSAPHEKKAKKERRFAHDSQEYLLAVQLKDGIMHNNADHKEITEAQLQKWADVMRLMMERDKRSFNQIQHMIDWCQHDDFWLTNILSASSLRRNYDKMKVRATTEWRGKHHGQTKRVEKLPDWAKNQQPSQLQHTAPPEKGREKPSADQLAESKRLLEELQNKQKAGAKSD